MKNKQTWILLADGAHARIYLNDGVGKGIKPVPGAVFDETILPTREINADKPGMSFGSVGQGRRRKQPKTDPNRQAKFNFAKQLAAFLEQEHNNNRFDRLILVASPGTLGDLRAVLPPSIRHIVYGELDKDLMHIKEQELPDHLNAMLAL